MLFMMQSCTEDKYNSIKDSISGSSESYKPGGEEATV